MPMPAAHHVDSLRHPTGADALWVELCGVRAELAAAELACDRLARERDELTEEVETARRLLAGYRDDVLRSLIPCR